MLKNWNFMRFLRLAMGIFIIAQGVVLHQWMYVIFGVFFSAMPILNIGCCANNNCNTNTKLNKKDKKEDLVYEEVY